MTELVSIIVAAVGLYAVHVSRFDPKIKTIINAIVGAAVLLWLLEISGFRFPS